MTASNDELVQIERARASTVRPLDNTAVSCFAECPRRYYYSMVRHFRKEPSAALHYGSTWHAILETHYRSGGDVHEVTKAAIVAWDAGPHIEGDHRTLHRALNAYESYRERIMPTESFEQTVGWPDAPLIEMSLNTHWDGAPLPYAGKVDRVIRLGGQLYVQDHKTTSVLGSTYFRGYELAPQMMGYVWLMQQFVGEPIAGVQINAYGIMKSEDRFERQVVPYSQARLREWATKTLPWWMNQILAMTEAWRSELLNEGVDNPEHWPMNMTSCSGKFGMCDYASVCSMAPSVRERYLEQNFKYLPWNPLEAV